MGQRVGHLPRDRECLGTAKRRPALRRIRERSAVDEGHDVVQEAGRADRSRERQDVGMAEAGDDADLTQEALRADRLGEIRGSTLRATRRACFRSSRGRPCPCRRVRARARWRSGAPVPRRGGRGCPAACHPCGGMALKNGPRFDRPPVGRGSRPRLNAPGSPTAPQPIQSTWNPTVRRSPGRRPTWVGLVPGLPNKPTPQKLGQDQPDGVFPASTSA